MALTVPKGSFPKGNRCEGCFATIRRNYSLPSPSRVDELSGTSHALKRTSSPTIEAICKTLEMDHDGSFFKGRQPGVDVGRGRLPSSVETISHVWPEDQSLGRGGNSVPAETVSVTFEMDP